MVLDGLTYLTWYGTKGTKIAVFDQPHTQPMAEGSNNPKAMALSEGALSQSATLREGNARSIVVGDARYQIS